MEQERGHPFALPHVVRFANSQDLDVSRAVVRQIQMA
jgi:hypothetical protein